MQSPQVFGAAFRQRSSLTALKMRPRPRADNCSMYTRRLLLVALVFATLATVAVAADVDRGRALYEANCGECHSTAAHNRTSHVAADFDSIRAWIRRWNQNLALQWTEEDVADVAIYLNTTYYRYPCPPDVCTVVGTSQSRPRL